jgi:hypothetical protein
MASCKWSGSPHARGQETPQARSPGALSHWHGVGCSAAGASRGTTTARVRKRPGSAAYFPAGSAARRSGAATGRRACGIPHGCGPASCGGFRGNAGPDQHGAIPIDSQLLNLDELRLQIVQIGVIEGKLPLQRAIGHSSAAPEQLDDLVDYRKEVHHGFSTCASTASASGSQKVMSIARYSAMALENSAVACSRRSLFA